MIIAGFDDKLPHPRHGSGVILIQQIGLYITRRSPLKLFRLPVLATLILALLVSCVVHASQPITGVYRLTTRGQNGLALDVWGYQNQNQTPVQLWYATHNFNQQWLVEDQGDGTYKISAFSGQNSLQVLDYEGGNIFNGNPVTTYEDTGSDNQRWYFRDIGGGYYRIIPKHAVAWGQDGQGLDMANGNNAGPGSTAGIYYYYGGNNQVFKLDWAGVSKILPNPKKGLGGRENKVPYMNGSWVYNWGGGEPADTPTNVEFVPMIWGYYGGDLTSYARWAISQPGVKNLLGFNEPDNSGQANLQTWQALDAWWQLDALPVPLGSPACVDASDQWMRDFMNGANSQGQRVDFVTIHWYGGNDPQGFLNYIDYIHWLYNKPVWVTEFAPTDWSGNGGVTQGDAMWFMRQVIPAMNSRSYVQRYAWFSANTNDRVLGQEALVNPDGTLTALGNLYARL